MRGSIGRCFSRIGTGLRSIFPSSSITTCTSPTRNPRIESQLQDGDFVNVVRGVTKQGGDENSKTFGGDAFVGHVGLIVNGPDGTVHMIHSSEPAVREEPLVDYIGRQNEDRDGKKAGKPVLLGFKFLRLEADPMANLRKIDGEDAPRVTLPRGGEAKF